MWHTHTQWNATQPKKKKKRRKKTQKQKLARKKKKKKRNLAIVTTGMDLKNIMLNEISQIDMYCMFLLIRGI